MAPAKEQGSPGLVPAAGKFLSARIYDPAVAFGMREKAWRPALVERVVRSCPVDATVLDIGAGTGTLAIELAAAGPRLAVIAIEPDPEARRIATAKPGAERVRWQAGNGLDLGSVPGLEAGSVDAVVMSLVLHHVDRDGQRTALKEANRILKPGGHLHVADFGRPRDPLMWAAFTVLRANDGFANTATHAAGELPAEIQSAGFDLVDGTHRLRTLFGHLELITAVRPAAQAHTAHLAISIRSLP